MKRFTVIFDRDAAADLIAIRDHIAEERGLDFANQFVERITAYCESFATIPHRGTRREAIRAGLRTTSWRRTVTVAFQVSDEARRVVILGVFYRGRDVLAALKAKD
ncbi:MAG: type II toxin-antitoxin system RelE/ParE family toxin [Terricaulis sp.]